MVSSVFAFSSLLLFVFLTNIGFSSAGLAPVYYYDDPTIIENVKRSSPSSSKDYVVVIDIDVPTLAMANRTKTGKSSITPKDPLWTQIARDALELQVDVLKSLLPKAKRQALNQTLGQTTFSVIGSFFSFTGSFDDETVLIIRAMKATKFIQQVIPISDDGNNLSEYQNDFVTQNSKRDADQSGYPLPLIKKQDANTYFQRYAPWAIARLSSTTLPSPIYPYGNGFSYKNGGDGVVIYVIDSGVNIDHQEFGGRASFGPNVAYTQSGALAEDDYDHNGHGTAVAALAIGTSLGVAKKAKVISYKGVAALSGLTDAIVVSILSDITQLISTATDGRKASIVVCSYATTSRSAIWDAAVTQFAQLGYTYVSPAGNQKASACNRSPAGSLATVAVGATDYKDGYYVNTNFGPCVDLFAPGVSVMTAGVASTYSVNLATGTSYSCGLVAGIIAMLLSQDPTLTQDQVKAGLLSLAANNVLTSTLANTVNILAQVPY
ncbi:Subtilisin-like protease [Smittium mucronatum]|uniref:Subtilisin-like protease n=1 Tax=Smittium mucronatum TaxID=133383 RepID=A0A1R0GUS5_9FUNG|nr:Subtilisin-like protease [Smittium mucronatum]